MTKTIAFTFLLIFSITANEQIEAFKAEENSVDVTADSFLSKKSDGAFKTELECKLSDYKSAYDLIRESSKQLAENNCLETFKTNEPKQGCDQKCPSSSMPISDRDESCEIWFDDDHWCDPEKRWYFEFKPGYYSFSDGDMRRFFDDGGFVFRAETGYRFWDYMMLWIDGSYFQKTGTAIGGSEQLKIKLANLTIGLKGIYYFNDQIAMYAGAGPRLFMMLLHNSSPFVRGDDNEIGIGGGFSGGFWFYPVPSWENIFLDAFVDYSLKELKIEEDGVSSIDNNVDVSGLSIGLGLGIRF